MKMSILPDCIERMSKPGLAAAALLVGLTGCARTQIPSGASNLTAAGDQETAGFQEALSIARQRYPDAPALGVEFETEDGRRMIEVALWEGSNVREIYVDPRTRRIVKEEMDEPSSEQAQAILQTVQQDITLEQGIDKALNEHAAKAIQEVELEMSDAQAVFEVEIKDDDGTADWIYDAQTGQVLKREKQGFLGRFDW